MYCIRYQLSLRQVEDILHERGIDICHETIRYLKKLMVSCIVYGAPLIMKE